MGAAKPYQRIGGVAKTEQRAANFEIEIGVRRTGRSGFPQIENECQEDGEQDDSAADQEARAHQPRGSGIPLLSEKPCDLAQTPHKIPQMPKKTRNYQGMQVCAL